MADVAQLRQKAIGSGTFTVNLTCHQLFTTRQRFESNGMQALSVDVLPMEDARTLLTSKRPDLDSETQAVARVCQALGRLPLGLALARPSLSENRK